MFRLVTDEQVTVRATPELIAQEVRRCLDADLGPVSGNDDTEKVTRQATAQLQPGERANIYVSHDRNGAPFTVYEVYRLHGDYRDFDG